MKLGGRRLNLERSFAWVKVLFSWILFLALAQFALADNHLSPDVIAVDPTEVASRFGDKITFYEESDGPLQLPDVIALEESGAFQRLNKREPSFGLSKSVYWVRFEVISKAVEPDNWVISLGKAYLALAEVAIQTDSGTNLILTDGKTVSYFDRNYPNRVIVTEPFQLRPDEKVTIWLRYSSDVSSNLPLAILTEEAHLQDASAKDIQMAIFLTFGTAIAVFSAVMAFVLRSKVAIFYAGFFISGLAFIAQANGVFFQHVWPSAPEFNAFVAHPISMLILIFGALFGREFIIFAGAPRILNWMSLALVFAGCVGLLMPLVLDVFFARKLSSALSIVFILSQFFNSAVAFHFRRPGSFFFLCATIILFVYIGAFTATLILAPGLLNSNAYLIFQYGQLLDGCVFAAAVFRMTHVLHKNTADAIEIAEAKTKELSQTRHDLRQPLLTLRTSIEHIEGKRANFRPDVLNRLSESIEYLDNVLTGTATETGPAEASASLTITEIVDSAVFMFTEDAKQAGQKIEMKGSSDHEISDPTGLLRILSNLLSNATRHSQGDQITVTIADGVDTQIGVRDNGTGLALNDSPPKESGWIDSLSPRSNGQGIGIIQQIAAENSWRVSFESKAGQGTEFRISGFSPEAAH